MRRITSKNTRPEVAVRSLLHRMGFRFRLHRRDLPGCPDLVFPAKRKLIFVHGCFWHQHSTCIAGRMPKSQKSYWHPKLRANVERDRTNLRRLRRMGWNVKVIWECEVLLSKQFADRLKRFLTS